MQPTQYGVEDTIAAIASSDGGLRGVVRISGPDACRVAERMFRDDDNRGTASQLASARRPFVVRWKLPTDLGPLPCDAHVWPSSASYTRQPSCEFHVAGARPVLEEVLRLATSCGARLAQPGEFTLRAFLAGRVDLLQAEAVLALVEARTGPQMHAALDQLSGGVSQKLAALKTDLVSALAELEAGLDFVEEDIEFISTERLIDLLDAARAQVVDMLAQLKNRQTRQIPMVLLAGRPNVGKSSLFNALAEADAAIVSPQAGATRDYVEHHAAWEGVRLRLIDTAGLLEKATDHIDASAQEKARELLSQASIVLWCRVCGDATAATQPPLPAHIRVIEVETKSDLAGERRPGTAVSVRTGEGLAALREAITSALKDSGLTPLVGSHERCRADLDEARRALESALAVAESGDGDELAAVELRLALQAVGRLAGEVHTDDLLDAIFSRFCIGK